nr:NF-kappa-B inhibitor epsilon [Pelodiscus sinensis]|eukprot:XP_006126612.1 NF-kappa-B inhibitor epsilon [Pelodiscus sinensis]
MLQDLLDMMVRGACTGCSSLRIDNPGCSQELSKAVSQSWDIKIVSPCTQETQQEGSELEEGQCDSGIYSIPSIRSLPGPPGEGEHPPGLGHAARKETQQEGSELEEGQCDSGIYSIPSIRSLPGPPGEGEHPPGLGDTLREKDSGPLGKEGTDALEAEERVDSTYGSASLTEPLTALGQFPEEEEEAAEGLSQQQLEALTYISEDGDTLLHLAIIHSVPALAFCCITQLPREVLEIQNDLFQTPLHLAVYLEQPNVVRALIHKGVSLTLQDRNGNTPLHVACEQQNVQCAKQLLEPAPGESTEPQRSLQDLQLQNWQGLACLHISTLKGNQQLMGLLLHSGADINVQDGTSGKTPLHLAVESRDRRTVKYLLSKGAHVDAPMYNGCTPLHLAVGRKDATMAAILYHSGADTLLRNMEDETAQDLADGNDDLLALLPFDDLKISGKPVVCAD